MENLITEFQNPVTRYTIITNFEKVKGRQTHNFLSKMIMSEERVSPRVFESYLNMFPESIFIRDSNGNFPEDYLVQYGRVDLLDLFSEIKETISAEQMLDPANTATERATRDMYEISLDDLMEYQESSIQGQLEQQKLEIAAGLEPTPLIPTSKGIQQRITQLKAEDQQRQRILLANKLKEAEQRAAVIQAKLLAVQTEEANRMAEQLMAEEASAPKTKKGGKAAAQPPKQSPQEIQARKERERLQQQEEKRRLNEIKAEEQRIISLAKAQEKYEKELQLQEQAIREKRRKDQEKAERQRLKAEQQRLKTERRLEQDRQQQALKQLEQQSRNIANTLLDEPQPGLNPAARTFMPRAPLPYLPDEDDLLDPDDLLKPSFGKTKDLKSLSNTIKYLKQL